ncbi:hypothetical protein NP493_1656g00010, partial [Ridgeia piscesae]
CSRRLVTFLLQSTLLLTSSSLTTCRVSLTVDCPLCNNTASAPGFAPDPNDCQAYYMCIPYANGAVWVGRRMTCAKYVQWESPPSPRHSPSSGLTDEKRSITCVTFDEANNALATNGLWVLNENVKVVDHPGVCKYGKCGYFPGNGTLEIPFFVNNYQNFKHNSDCLNGADKDDSSSVYVSSPSQNLFNAGLKATDGSAADVKFQWWHHIAVVWDGKKVTFYHDKQEVKVLDFSGVLLQKRSQRTGSVDHRRPS